MSDNHSNAPASDASLHGNDEVQAIPQFNVPHRTVVPFTLAGAMLPETTATTRQGLDFDGPATSYDAFQLLTPNEPTPVTVIEDAGESTSNTARQIPGGPVRLSQYPWVSGNSSNVSAKRALRITFHKRVTLLGIAINPEVTGLCRQKKF